MDIFSICTSELKELSKKLDIKYDSLKFYFIERKFPLGRDLEMICSHFNISKIQAKILWEVFDGEVAAYLKENILNISGEDKLPIPDKRTLNRVFETELGRLYQNDCLDYLATVEDETFDVVFADPPFNLNKDYPSKMNDNLKEADYIDWMSKWILELVRTLKSGGSLFIWNLPKWNIQIVKLLEKLLCFKHWIAVDIKYSLPIKGRLYPSHYSILYFTKGKRAKTFKPDRLPMQLCTKCHEELKDYGGYKSKMNPKGISLTDVWYDIPPVRHAKYKRRKGANELSIKLLDRIIEMSSNPGDLIYDPFGGSGSTYIVAELKGRQWVGTEIGPPDEIIERFKIKETEKIFLDKHREELNCLFIEKNKKMREDKGLWI